MKTWSVGEVSLLKTCLAPLVPFILALVCLLLPAGGAWAFACTSTGGNWATNGTWANCNGTTPQAGDTVTITAGTVILNASPTIAGLTMNGGTLTFGNSATIRTLTVNGNVTVTAGTINVANQTVTHVLNVSGNVTNNGTLDLRLDANSLCTLNFTGGGAHIIDGTSAGTTEFNNVTVANNLTINKSGAAITQTGTLSVTGNLTVQAGTLNVANSITVTGTTDISGTLSHTTTTGTRTFTGNVTINNGGTMSETVAEAIAYGGNLTVSAGGTLTEFGAATMSVAGNLQNDGTLTASTGVHTFSGAAKTFSGANAIVIPSVTVSGTYQNSGTLTVNTALSGAGTLTNTGTLNIGGTSGITGLTATAVGNTVNYTSGGAQAIKATTYDILNTSGAGAKTIGGVTVVNDTLTVVGGTLTNNSTLTVTNALSGTGGLTNGAADTLNIGGTSGITTLTATAAGNTVNYTGTGQTLKVTSYQNLTLSGGPETFGAITTIGGNLTLSGSATATTAANLAITGNLDVGSGTQLTVAGFNITVTGTTSVTGTLLHNNAAGTKTYTGNVTINNGGLWNETAAEDFSFGGNLQNDGTLTASTGVHTFINAGRTFSGANEIAIPSVTISGTRTNNGTLTVSTTLAGASTLTNGATGILNIGAATVTPTLTATAVGNTVNYTGTGQTLKVTAYHHLTLSGGAETFGAITTVAGNLTLSGSATATTAANLAITGNLDVGGGTQLTVAGFNITVTGTTAVTGTLVHNNAAGAKTYTGNVTINNGGLWNETAAEDFSFGGNLQNDGTFTANTGVHTFINAGRTFSGANEIAIPSVTISGTRTNDGTLTVSTTLAGASTLTNGATGTLNIGGTSGITGLTATAGGNVVNYTGTGQTIKATSYDTLNVTGTGATNSGTVTAATGLGGSGDLTNAATGVLNLGGTVTIATLNATVGGNVVNYTGTGQTIRAIAYDTLNVTGTATNSGTVTVATALGGAGTLTNAATGVLNLGGTSLITTLTATASGNTVNYTGSGQTIKATTYHHLTLSGGAGTLGADTNVNGTLALGANKLTTGANTLLMTGDCSLSGGNGSITRSSSGFVIGNLRLSFPTGTNTCTFPVGSGTTYAPIGIAMVSTSAGTLTGSTTAGQHPQIATSGIDSTKDASRYWTLGLAGDTLNTGNVTSYGVTFNFAAGDLIGGATPSNFVVGKYTGAAWTLPTPVTANATATGVSFIAGSAGFGGFAVGERSFATCSSLASGNWNAPATWTTCRGGIPLAQDTVTINSPHAVALNIDSPALGSLTVNTGGSLTNAANRILSLAGNLTNNGTLTMGTGGSITLTAHSQWTGSATSTWTLYQVDLGTKDLTFGATDSYTVSFASATPIVNVGNLNMTGTNSTVTFRFAGAAQALPVDNVRYPSVVLAGTGAKTLTGTGTTLDVRGSFKLNGAADTPVGSDTFSAGSRNVDIYGDFTNNRAANFNPGNTDSGTWTFKGTTLQNIDSTGTSTIFPNLTLNNTLGIALNASSSVKTLLTLTNGYISTGTNILILSTNCTDVSATNGTSWVRTNGFVSGRVRLTFSSGTVTCTYPVGSGTTYAPIGMTMISTGGTLTGSTTTGEHPQISASTINSTLDVSRYWSLWATGDAITSSSYGATFNFVAGDVDVGANTANFVVGKYAASTWTELTPAFANPTATGVSTITGGITAQTDFAVGTHSSNNCYSDAFTGADGASPGGNWSVGFKTGTFGNPVIWGNRLRLTNATGSVATWATLNRLIPASGNRVTVELEHFAHSGTGSADGIAVILSDASVAPQAGAFGGSLGYAQKSNPGSDCTTPGGCPGFTGGWLGIAIDEYGNYSTNLEGRFGGVGARIQNSVAIRGSGTGMSGYRFLTGTGSLTPVIDGNNAATPPHRYRIIIDHTDGLHAWTSVERDTTGGGTAYVILIGCPPGVTSGCTALDVKDPGYSQNDVPTSWNLSFTGSTGGSTNVHEVDNLSICTVQGMPTPSLHHIKIEHGGNACTSAPATVTVKACADVNCTALYMDPVTVNLDNVGTWSSDPVTFSGGSTTVTLTGTGSVTLGGTATSPTTANATQCFSGATETCSLTFNSCTFDAIEVGANANTPIFTKLAGYAFNLDVLSQAAQTVTAIDLVDVSTGNCNTPAAVLSPVTLAPALSGGVPIFTAGQRKTFSFTYANAAPNVRVRIATAGPNYSCSSDNFAIRPTSYTVTSSASQAGSSGSPFFRAGTDTFTLTATAVNASSATTSTYLGLPKLNSSLVTSVQAHAGTTTNVTFPNATAGVAIGSGFKYSEVGNISLGLNAIYDDSFAQVDTAKAECTSGFNNGTPAGTPDANGKFSCQFGSAVPAQNFGRFVPDHFTVVGTINNACSSGTFTYMGQNFTLSSTSVVQAQNASGVVTQNYAGAYAPGTVSFAAENADSGTDLSSRLAFASGTWTLGVYILSSTNASFSRPVTTTSDATWGVFDTLDVGLTVNDSDVSTSPKVSGADLNPTVAGGSTFTYKKFSGSPLRMRFGMLKLDSTSGSEANNMPVTVKALYWDGTSWQINTSDGCTSIPYTALNLSNYKGALNPATNMSGNHLPTTATLLSGGTSSITVTKPFPSAKGSVDLAINLGATGADNCTSTTATAANLSWLRGNTCDGLSYDKDPIARITFGAAKSPFIYIREKY
ncbi:MAG: hypothetical protein HY847_11045 [Betaproteobacteria bacterium]|nr:hypothetical protein [Betaproteobacteria bacterium]